MAQSCWKGLKLKEFPFKHTELVQQNKDDIIFVKKPNIFSRNVNQECLDHIRSVIDQTRYIVYPLSNADWESGVWQRSGSLLILSESSLNENHEHEILKVNDYICNERGKVLLLLNKDCYHSGDQGSIFQLLKSDENITQNLGCWTWRKVDGMLCLFGLMESPSFVITWASSDLIDERTIKSALELMEISCVGEEHPIPPTSEVLLSLKPTDAVCTEKWKSVAELLSDEIKAIVDVVSPGHSDFSFSFSDYLSALGGNSKLGRNVFWADVLPSNFTILKSILPKLPKQSGLVLISATQTAGIGGGNNKWISPRGMACFTLHYDLPLLEGEPSCKPTQVLMWTRYLPSLAVAQTLNELLCQYNEGNELNIEMKIKWPNDVYAIDKKTSTASKISGTLPRTGFSDTTKAKCLVGIGINVANRFPTTCLYEMIQRYNANKNIELPSIATVIGRTIYHLEKLISQLESGDVEGIKELYSKSWMHSGQRIRGMCEDESIECSITGVDDFGYLKATKVENGESVTLHPDGKSIDMIAGTVISRIY